jgi:hypothetical protein
MRTAVKAQSPSQVFAAIGKDIVDGLRVGVAGGTPLFTQSLTQLASAGTTALQAALNKQKQMQLEWMRDATYLAGHDHESLAAASADLVKYFGGPQSAHESVGTAGGGGGGINVQIGSIQVSRAVGNIEELADGVREALLRRTDLVTIFGSRGSGRRR